jgi:hypothetical protein
VHVPVRVYVRDLNALLPDGIELASELALDLVHREASEKRSDSQVAGLAKSTRRSCQGRNLIRGHERTFLIVAHERQVHSEVELGMSTRERDRLFRRWHCGHD